MGLTFYIYTFEDSEIMVRRHEPLRDDYQSVDTGILTVLKITNNKVFDLEPDGTWSEVPIHD